MIRAILFDLDGVLTTDRTGSATTLRALAAQAGITEERLWNAFAPFNDDLLLGRVTHEDIWPDLCRRLGRQLEFHWLIRAFDSTPMNADMLAYAAALKARYAVGIVTDNKADRVDRLAARHGLARLFDPIVVSADYGSGKDTPAIFRHALVRLGVAADECIFIDNTPKNLVAPASIGIHTVHFSDDTGSAGSLSNQLEAQFGVSGS